MKPIILLGALAGAAAYLFSREDEAKAAPGGTVAPRPGQPQPGGEVRSPGLPPMPSIPAPPPGQAGDAIPPGIVARMMAVLATGDPAAIRREADKLEREGWPTQAQELRAAADTLDTFVGVVGDVPVVLVPPPGATPVVTPPGPPPMGPTPKAPEVITVRPPAPKKPAGAGKPPEAPRPVIVVPAPPVGAVPVPPPAAGIDLIPDMTSLAGRTALMLYESGNGPAKDPALLAAYKKSVGLKDPGHLYGPGTAKSLMVREIVPPVPWDWPARDKAKSVKDLVDNLNYKARKDPARSEEWAQAAKAVKAKHG